MLEQIINNNPLITGSAGAAMTQQQKFFVVVDPTAEQHIALERAIIIAKLS